MAENKKKSSTVKNGTAAKKASHHRRTAEDINTYHDQMAFETGITILILSVVALFLYASYFGVCGKVGFFLGGFMFSLFGWIAWLLPLYVIVGYAFVLANRKDPRVPRRLISFAGFFISLAAFIDLLQSHICGTFTEIYQGQKIMHKNTFACIYKTFEYIVKNEKGNCGIIHRWISKVLEVCTGSVGAGIILFAIMLLSLYFFYGIEMFATLRRRNQYQQEMVAAEKKMSAQERYEAPSYRVNPARGVQGQEDRRAASASRNRRTSSGSHTSSGRDFQPVDLKKSGEKIDQMEAGTKKRPSSKRETKRAGRPEMEEIRGEAGEIEMPKNTRPVRKKPVESELGEAAQIPIFREEMNQKFHREEAGTRKRASGTAKGRAADDGVPNADAQTESAGMPELPEEDHVITATGKIIPRGSKKDILEKKRAQGKTSTAQSRVEQKAARQAEQESGRGMPAMQESGPKKPYRFPPLDLLSMPENSGSGVSDEQLRETALRLQETLESFGVNVTLGAVTCGPTVTRYEVLPEHGVRVNRITNLADDLKLSLAAANIRIEAPIPGKSAVGIEVPNPVASAVSFRELLEGTTFSKAKSPLTFAVGKDIAGKLIMGDIAKMPHLLIAGATGSGKSVCINTLIMSILYKADPDDVKLIMIDPKVVELSVYNGIPHLFCPVVTDAKEAAASLNWAVREMMDRYNKFKELGVRNMEGYNKKIRTVPDAAQAGYEKMPYLVIIVDEFADLMMVASKEVEDAVCRLAQLARAAGIHLILATQRPSVNVITGVIKANIPSRIAFSVSSSVDSRTILDKGGAEKLLGKGDMLFFPTGQTEPVRVQGAFVSDKEVSDVVDFLIGNNETPVYNNKVTEIVETETPAGGAETKDNSKPDRDEFFEEAGRFVIESERAAAGQLQRRFSIGFNRAGRIIDQLHEAGVVGPAVGTKPRQVLMNMEQFENYLGLGTEAGTPVPDEEFDSAVEGFAESSFQEQEGGM